METLESIVADLEYCKELKKLGVKQDSLFYWEGNEVLSEWTSTELGDVLRRIELPKDYSLTIGYTRSEWQATLIFPEQNDWLTLSQDVVEFKNDSEANLRAGVIIYLLKNNIISLEEVNKNI